MPSTGRFNRMGNDTGNEPPADPPLTRGVLLEDITWVEAEKVLTPETVVVIPLGAAAKEHGPHLPLKNDFVLAEYFKNRVLECADVVVAPTLNFHFYPAFIEYPGSTSLRLETARDLVIDICRSLARFGPCRFYVLNTGVSTIAALHPAAEALSAEGVLLTYTKLSDLAETRSSLREQEGGTHADELETSMMLYLAPHLVDMSKAAKDYTSSPGGGLTRDPNNDQGTYSATGTWGDATLATVEKGKVLTDAMVDLILNDIKDLRAAPLPSGR